MKVLTASAALGLAAAAVAGGNGDRREGRPLLGKPTYDPECDEGVTKIILRQFSRYEDLVYGLCLQMFDIDYDTVLREYPRCCLVCVRAAHHRPGKTKITTTVSGTRTVTFTSVVRPFLISRRFNTGLTPGRQQVPVTATASATVTTTTTTATTRSAPSIAC